MPHITQQWVIADRRQLMMARAQRDHVDLGDAQAATTTSATLAAASTCTRSATSSQPPPQRHPVVHSRESAASISSPVTVTFSATSPTPARQIGPPVADRDRRSQHQHRLRRRNRQLDQNTTGRALAKTSPTPGRRDQRQPHHPAYRQAKARPTKAPSSKTGARRRLRGQRGRRRHQVLRRRPVKAYRVPSSEVDAA